MQTETRTTGIADAVIEEMEQEAVITQRLFDVIPDDKLSWRPHPKARTLGALAFHVAWIPQGVAELADADVREVGNIPGDTEPKSRAEIVDTFKAAVARAKEILSATDDAKARAEWTLTRDGQTIVQMPRVAFWRSVLLNHYYHHRGQLSAYLRELDVELPSIYGPSADTDPFA